MTIVTTPGSPTANSYGSVAEADAYFANRPFSTVWSALDASGKEAALIYATQISSMYVVSYWDEKQLPEDATIRVLASISGDVDETVVWNGEPTDGDQALAWPRRGVKNQNGFDLADDVVPTRLKHWQFEIAMQAQAQDRTAENAAKFAGLSGLKAGPVDLKFASVLQNPSLVSDATMLVLVPSWFYAFKIIYQNKLQWVSI